MKCEYCNRTLRQGDMINGIRHGTLTSTGFKADQDSAVIVICGTCGEQISRIVYGRLENREVTFPVMFKMHEELTVLMKNGYKFVQSMAKLPRTELVALQKMIALCKISN